MSSLSSHLPRASARADQATWLERALPLLAAAFCGFGVVMWVAANWDTFGKFTRFSLVGLVVVLAAIVGATVPRWRSASGIVGLLSMGGLLALFGQTYQTGADPWQLFALWAALALPWTWAARHDAVWSLWVAVAFAAIGLWLAAEAGMGGREIGTVVAGALIGLVVSALVGPPLKQALPTLALQRGRTRWAFLLAVMAWCVLLATYGLVDILDGSRPGGIILVSLGLLASAAAGLALRRPLELGPLAAVALAIDTLLVAIVGRALVGSIAGLLFIGLIAAAIVAGSAILLIRLARSSGGSSPLTGVLEGRAWPIIVLSGLGALMATIPFLAFFAAAFGGFLTRQAGPFVIGFTLLAAALAAIRVARPLGFLQQVGFIGLVVAGSTLAFGFYRDLSLVAASAAMLTIVIATALSIPVGWIRVTLGAAAALFAALLVASLIDGGQRILASPAAFRFVWIIVVLGGTLALFGLHARPASARSTEPTRATLLSTGAVVEGWLAAALLGLMAAAGMTFLLGGALMPGAARLGIQDPFAGYERAAQALSLAAVLGAVFLMTTHRLARTSPTVLAGGGVAAALSFVMPLLGPALLAAAVAWRSNHRVLTGLAVVAALWIVGAFYYWLGWPLVQKAYLMLALGAVAALAAVLQGGLSGVRTVPSAGAPAFGRALAPLLIAASAVATLGVTAYGVRAKEALLATGRLVYVALAPVDPRSLMQGDFMALRFALPPNTPAPPSAVAPRFAIAKLDDRNVATVTRYAGTADVGAGELAFALARRGRRPTIGTDAWYFKEGTAQLYEAARFGLFRVGPSGESLLVGLADESLSVLK